MNATLGEAATVAPTTFMDPARCKFGLCRRLAEHQVLTADGWTDELLEVVEVCDLHVTPAIAWGRVTSVKEVTIRPI